jgi:hypothetical protein
VPFNDLQESFDGFIRPKLRSFFKGGLTRRIDAVVPFFKFSREEAYVVADMYIDTVREMYAKPRTPGRSSGFVSIVMMTVPIHAGFTVSRLFHYLCLEASPSIATRSAPLSSLSTLQFIEPVLPCPTLSYSFLLPLLQSASLVIWTSL